MERDTQCPPLSSLTHAPMVSSHTRGSTHTPMDPLIQPWAHSHSHTCGYAHTHIHTHGCAHTHTRVGACTLTHTWARSHSHPCGCAHTHTHVGAFTLTPPWVHLHSHTCGFTHTPVDALILTHMLGVLTLTHPWVRSHSQMTRELNIRGNTLEFALLICSFQRLLISLHSYHWLFIPEHPRAHRGNWCLLSQSTRPPFWELLCSPFPHLHGFSIPEVSVIKSIHMASLAVFLFFLVWCFQSLLVFKPSYRLIITHRIAAWPP